MNPDTSFSPTDSETEDAKAVREHMKKTIKKRRKNQTENKTWAEKKMEIVNQLAAARAANDGHQNP